MNSVPKRKNKRLGRCEICKKEYAKYTCPACEKYTCSLTCNTAHKKESECDGIRSRTSYIPLMKFGDLDLLSDVRFLEDAGRCVEKCFKDKTKRYSRSNQLLPIQLHRLSKAASQRGTRLIFLPQHFTRHKNNTTYFDWKAKEISWKIQLTFLNADMLTYHEEKCHENIILQEIISKYINTNPVTKALKSYNTAGIDSIDVLLKVEKASEPLKKFYKLDPKLSLKDNLYRKVVVEYPQLFVVIKDFYASMTTDEIEKEKLVDSKNSKVNDYLQLREGTEEPSDKQEDEKEMDVESDESINPISDEEDDNIVTKSLPQNNNLITLS